MLIITCGAGLLCVVLYWIDKAKMPLLTSSKEVVIMSIMWAVIFHFPVRCGGTPDVASVGVKKLGLGLVFLLWQWGWICFSDRCKSVLEYYFVFLICRKGLLKAHSV